MYSGGRPMRFAQRRRLAVHVHEHDAAERFAADPGQPRAVPDHFGTNVSSSLICLSLPSRQYCQPWNAQVKCATLPRSLSATRLPRCGQTLKKARMAPIGLAHHQDRFAADLEREIVAVLGNVACDSRDQPHARPQPRRSPSPSIRASSSASGRRRRCRCRRKAAWLPGKRPAHRDSPASRAACCRPWTPRESSRRLYQSWAVKKQSVLFV